MANQVAARLAGDDYQHLITWFHALELLMPQRRVSTVVVEDDTAGSADDVTLLHDDPAGFPDRYHQVKYHVDHRDSYSVQTLTERTGNGRSLLQKWFRAWVGLSRRPARPAQIHIVSTWGWAADDALAPMVDGRSNALKDEFFATEGAKGVVQLRAELQSHLDTSEELFVEFARALHFHFGYSCWQEMAERTAERMENLGLKHSETDLLVAVGVVRNWITSGRQAITREVLESVIGHHDLTIPAAETPGVNVHLSTIKEQRFDVEPDYLLDWRGYFLGGPTRSHDPVDPLYWNDTMLPELQALEGRVGTETGNRLIRARGLARLSAWFAFGYVFCDVAGYTIEVDQQGQLWNCPDFEHTWLS